MQRQIAAQIGRGRRRWAKAKRRARKLRLYRPAAPPAMLLQRSCLFLKQWRVGATTLEAGASFELAYLPWTNVRTRAPRFCAGEQLRRTQQMCVIALERRAPPGHRQRHVVTGHRVSPSSTTVPARRRTAFVLRRCAEPSKPWDHS
jgi:hypothetical protein